MTTIQNKDLSVLPLEDPTLNSQLSDNLKVRKEQLISLARAAENAERYEDMCMYIRKLIRTISESDSSIGVSIDERNQLSVAYKNVVGARRASWRNQPHDDCRDNPSLNEYKNQQEDEQQSICMEILELIEEYLINSLKEDEEAQVFYLKMAGDYYRYLAEFRDRKRGFHEKAKLFYQRALDLATGQVEGKKALPPTHPIRLGQALNFSVCYYEILGEHDEARALAKQAFEDAILRLDDLDEHAYKDSILIMGLLRDNLNLWKTEPGSESDPYYDE